MVLNLKLYSCSSNNVYGSVVSSVGGMADFLFKEQETVQSQLCWGAGACIIPFFTQVSLSILVKNELAPSNFYKTLQDRFWRKHSSLTPWLTHYMHIFMHIKRQPLSEVEILKSCFIEQLKIKLIYGEFHFDIP